MTDITSIVSGTAVSNRRRSQRVFLKVRVVARFRLLEHEWIVDGDTVVVNAHGGTLRLAVAPMAAGDAITLTNPATDQAESCRVVRVEAMPSNLIEAMPSNLVEAMPSNLVESTSNRSIEPTASRSAEVMQSRLVQAMQHRIARSRSSRLIHPAPRRRPAARSRQVFEVAFAFDRPSPHFWAVAFPPTDWIESLINH
jgi:hypothetical protein